MKRFLRGAVALGATAAALSFLGVPAAWAHEQRHVGAYLFTVGWKNEPTYVGEQNAVQLFIHDAHGNPLDDLGTPPTLQVTVEFGGKSSAPLDLEASFDPDTGLGTHGEFDAALIPTQPGNYTFHFAGTVNGQPVNQSFTSGPATFNTVEDPTPIEFPTQIPTVPELATLEGRLSPRVDRAVAAASSGHSTASTARTLAVIAVILGAAGLVLGASALVVARRRSHA